MRIAVVGATGITGETLLKLLPESRLEWDELVLLASERSAETSLLVGRKHYKVEAVTEDSFDGVDLAFFAVGDELSKKFVPVALEKGAIVIDKSSVFRMDEKVPLVVVGVNETEISDARLISNPNCTTIMLCHTLYPLLPFGPREIYVASYQSLSGAGKEELKAFLRKVSTLPKEAIMDITSPELAQIFKAVPAIDEPIHLEYKEEKKIREETAKILNLYDAEIYATAVRIPTIIGHCVSVFVRLNHRASIEDVRLALEEDSFIELLPREEVPDTTLALSIPDKVIVGRVRAYFEEKCAGFFAVSNNIVLGAALNALLIAEYRMGVGS